MSSQNNNEKQNISDIGEIIVSWVFPEYVKYHRTSIWYFWFSVISLGFLSYSLIKLNFFLAVIVILFASIIFLHDMKEPMNISFHLGENGIILGNKMFDYQDLGSFWIVYEPLTIKKLYLEFNSLWKPPLAIPLTTQDPLRIREFLISKLKENIERDSEPLSDQFGRLLKL